jgi:hypothetical protein
MEGVGKQLDLLGCQPVFENPRTLVMAAVGRGDGDRLSSGGAASAPFGPTEKRFCNLSAAYVALHILFNQQTLLMRLCATTTKVSFVFYSPRYLFKGTPSFKSHKTDITCKDRYIN